MHYQSMKGFRLQLGLIAFTASVFVSVLGCVNENEGLKCTVDYIQLMTCCWARNISQNDPQCEVQVDDVGDYVYDEPEFPKICSPKSESSSSDRSCNITFLMFAAAQIFNVTLLCPRDGFPTEVAWISNFKPKYNIKLNPPFNLGVNISSFKTEISWQTESGVLIKDELEYEMEYKSEDEKWRIAKRLQFDHAEQRVSIELSHLKPNQFYAARIRTKTKDGPFYISTWSKWSPAVKWKTEESQASADKFSIILSTSLSLAGILVVVATLAISQLARRRSRAKKFHWLSVPDPGKFFYELNSTYGGNFQKWLGTTFPPSFNSTEDLATEISSVEISDIKDSETFIKQDYVSDSSGFKSIGNSSLSSFANQGYFWFSYPSTFEVDPCKVYFSYDRSGLGLGSEKSGSYRCLTSSNDSLYDSSQQYSPCSVFIGNEVIDLEHECSSAQTNTSGNAFMDEEIDCPPREPQDLSNAKSLQFSSELGNIGQLLRNGCLPKGSHGCLDSLSQIPIFESADYPFGSHVSLADITLRKKDEGVSRCGADGLMSGDGQMGPLLTSTETVLNTPSPQDGFSQESASIFKTMSLNLGQSSDAYLSLKEVQSKYSNQSI